MENSIDLVKQFFVDEKLVPKNKFADFDENQSLLETGIIDSLSLLRLVSFIEERFQVRLSDEELTPENFENLHAIVELIRRKTS